MKYRSVKYAYNNKEFPEGDPLHSKAIAFNSVSTNARQLRRAINRVTLAAVRREIKSGRPDLAVLARLRREREHGKMMRLCKRRSRELYLDIKFGLINGVFD